MCVCVFQHTLKTFSLILSESLQWSLLVWLKIWTLCHQIWPRGSTITAFLPAAINKQANKPKSNQEIPTEKQEYKSIYTARNAGWWAEVLADWQEYSWTFLVSEGASFRVCTLLEKTSSPWSWCHSEAISLSSAPLTYLVGLGLLFSCKVFEISLIITANSIISRCFPSSPKNNSDVSGKLSLWQPSPCCQLVR